MKLTKLLGLAAVMSGVFSNSAVMAQDAFNPDNVKGEITFYTHRTDLVEAGVYKRYEEEFKKLYPNVTGVKVIGFADYQGGIRPRMNTGDFGDVVLILPSVPSLQYKNFYEPLNDMYTEDEVYFHSSWSDPDGKNIYGISLGSSFEGLVYNKTVLKDAGVEVPLKTLDDFYAALEKIKQIGKIPMYINFGAQWPLQQWDKYPMVAEGTDGVYEKMLTQDKPFSGDTSYNKSLKILKTIISKGYTEKDLMTNSWEDSKNSFAKGDIGMVYFGNWVIPQFIEKGAKSDDIGFMPFPSNNEGKLYVQMNHDWGMAVSKFSKNKDTAKAYLKFLLEKSDYDTISGFIPTVKSKKVELAQLQEMLSYEPAIIQTPTNSNEFIAATNKSKIDFYSGGYIQDLMTSSDFEKSLEKLDARWNRAKKRVGK